MSDVTRLLNAANQGNRQAAVELLPLVYDELRKLAAARLAREKPGQTLDATALVHEAFLRLVGGQTFEGQRHFFAAAAEAIRRILVEQARRRQALKRGGKGTGKNSIPAASPPRPLMRSFSPCTRPSIASRKRIRRRPSWSSSATSPA